MMRSRFVWALLGFGVCGLGCGVEVDEPLAEGSEASRGRADDAFAFDWDSEPEVGVEVPLQLRFHREVTQSYSDFAPTTGFLGGELVERYQRPFTLRHWNGVLCHIRSSRGTGSVTIPRGGTYRLEATEDVAPARRWESDPAGERSSPYTRAWARVTLASNDEGLVRLDCQDREDGDEPYLRVTWAEIRDAFANAMTGTYAVLEPTLGADPPPPADFDSDLPPGELGDEAPDEQPEEPSFDGESDSGSDAANPPEDE